MPLEAIGEQAADIPPDHREVLEAVLSLPQKYREAVILHYYQGFSQEEIARALSVPPATVRSRLARARKKLEKALKGWYFDA